MAYSFAPQTGRLDRHVRRSYLRVSEGTSRHRIAYSLEEALRLATLPGEEEGRIYCFRSISLSRVPAEANRRIWVEQVQQVLGSIATQAVHASDENAGSTNAVFFNNIEEALETLLRKAVHAHTTSQSPAPDWFANSLVGAPPESGYAQQIQAILERLRPPSMPPGAAASILFAALGNADPVALLSAIPIANIREWLRELDGQTSLSASAPPVHLPYELKTTLKRSASHFGWKDPATIWLATQAVISRSPSSWSSGTAVKCARATLRALGEEQFKTPHDQIAITHRNAVGPSLVFDDDEISASQTHAPEDKSNGNLPHRDKVSPSAFSNNPSASPLLLGEATPSAGLYFLLNVLSSLGIASALEACPALAEATLATHILRRLAAEVGVADNDPILRCLCPPQTSFALPAKILATLLLQPEAWPNVFPVPRRAAIDSEYFLRVWTIAAKRWLWRMGRIAINDVINRSGRIWLTRTDLDVTLPLAAVDLRIRRIGLDIDPGWLPWFGDSGRVVRFHYRDSEPEEPA